MKLVVVATLIAACAAARLEHLERSYLPPDNSIISGQRRGSPGDLDSSFNLASSFSRLQGNSWNSFPSGSNRYLPPTKGVSSDTTRFISPIKGFGGNRQHSIPSMSYGTPKGPGASNSQGRSQFQFEAANRQYLAPNVNSKQNPQLGNPSRQYVTPNAGSSQNAYQQTGSSSGSQQQRFTASAASYGQGHQFGSATSRQYIAPYSSGFQDNNRHKIGASNVGEQQRFSASPSRQYLAAQANSFPSSGNNQLGVANNNQQQRFGAVTSRQYLAPFSSGSQSKPIGGFPVGQQKFKSTTSQYFASNAEQLSGSQKASTQFGPISRQLYLTPEAPGLSKPSRSGLQAMSGTGLSMNGSLGAFSREYLAPKVNSFQGVPQQAFNERTGYQY